MDVDACCCVQLMDIVIRIEFGIWAWRVSWSLTSGLVRIAVASSANPRISPNFYCLLVTSSCSTCHHTTKQIQNHKNLSTYTLDTLTHSTQTIGI